MQTRYDVWGLYEVCLKLAQGNQFYEVDAGIYLGEDELRWLTLDSVNTTAILVDSGKFADPDDENFIITFSWDGVRIKAQDKFTVFLDAFAISAPHNNTDLEAYIPAARSDTGAPPLQPTMTFAISAQAFTQMTWPPISTLRHR